ncbi:MAG: CBS domain-containing protein [Alphaproteobacteria bacterium]|nr:MAG: CBS domain-containing protein [Alphaproteobacteria bacterium]
MLVRQILASKGSSAVETIAPEATLAEAARRLREKRIGALVVSGDGARPEGILSERDIVAALARQGALCLEQTVAEVMTAEVATCAPSDRADDVLARMTAGRFRHMPVMEDGRMVGLISIGDVVKARLDELAHENAALADMIMGR